MAKQGYLAPQDNSGAGSQVAFSYCRSLYALALLFPPKLSSRTGRGRQETSEYPSAQKGECVRAL